LRIFPAEMQLVQTRTRLCVPLSVTIRAGCRLGRQTRLVLLLAWLTLFPLRGPFPQTAQKAIGTLLIPDSEAEHGEADKPKRARQYGQAPGASLV
jgi:hypothetical protein